MSRPEIIRELKTLIPDFKSKRTDTIQILKSKLDRTKFDLRFKNLLAELPSARLLQKTPKQELTNFLQNGDIGDSIEANAKDLIAEIGKIKLSNDKYLLMTDGHSFRVLSNIESFKKNLIKHSTGYILKEEQSVGSDVELMYRWLVLGERVKLSWESTNTDGNKMLSGAYFGYFHKTHLNLERYQIFSTMTLEKRAQRLNSEHCLFYALARAGIPKDKLDGIKLDVFMREFKASDLKRIAKRLGITIRLKYDNEGRFRDIGNGKQTIDLALLEGHYFIDEITNVTKYSLENDSELFTKKNFPSCRAPGSKATKFLSSREIVSYLLANPNLLEPISLSNIIDRQSIDKLHEYDRLRVLEPEEYEHIGEPSRAREKTEYSPNLADGTELWFVDTETFICEKKGYHVAYCLSAQKYSKNTPTMQSFYGLDCVKRFLLSVGKNAIVYCHNQAFDFRQFIDYLYDIETPVETGTRLKQVTAMSIYGSKIIFKDSYAVLPMKLAELPKALDLLSGDKDVYPYELISNENFCTKIPTEECLKHVSDTKAFIINATRCGALENGLVDIRAYTIYYCEQDVRILYQGVLKFAEMIWEIDSIDITGLISLPSIAQQYMINAGVYKSCYSISGIAQDFIRKTCVGGRTMTARNSKWHISQECVTEITRDGRTIIHPAVGKIADFDGVSLYPSAMSELAKLPCGVPKPLNVRQISRMNKCTQKGIMPEEFEIFFIKVEYTHISIKRDFPLQSFKLNGIRDYTNDIVGRTAEINNIDLAEMIKHHGIKCRVIGGYYFDNEYNPKLGDAIRFMFNERKRLKAAGNPLQNVYKLLMNSSYGKLLQKPITSTKVFVNSKNIKKFVSRKFKFINTYNKITDKMYAIKLKKSYVEHLSACHLASLILSMSKRIMNRVMCLAEDLGIQIYYQDTDSMHIPENRIPELAAAFKEKYNKDLIGTDLGQFHTDFSVADAGARDIAAIECIFVGKKVYADKLAYTVDGEIKHDFHLRGKGVPTGAIRDYNSDYMSTYRKLFDGQSVKFDIRKYIPLQLDQDFRARANTKLLTREMKF
jgi:hypothetical protein